MVEECVIARFCSAHLASKVEPAAAELETLLIDCSLLKFDDVVDAIYEQLSWSSGSCDWKPRLRALCMLEYFYQQEGTGKKLASAAAHEAEIVLHSLVDVPQCRELALRLLDMMAYDASLANKSRGAEVDSDLESEFVPTGSPRIGQDHSSSCSTTDVSDTDEQHAPLHASLHAMVTKGPSSAKPSVRAARLLPPKVTEPWTFSDTSESLMCSL
jgi:hypothetical protein